MVEEKRFEENSDSVLIDFEGDGNGSSGDYERVVVKEDVYTTKIVSLEVQDTKKYNAVGTEKTIIAKVVPVEGLGGIPFFIKPKITKAYNEKVSNSKLYDLLERAGLLVEAKERKEELSTLTGLAMFLEQKLVGRSIKFLTKTRKQGTEDAYSSVDRVLEFLPVEGEVKEEVKAEIINQETSQ